MPIKQRSVVGQFNDVMERLIGRLGEDNIYRTDVDGTIEFITDGEKLWVKADS